MSSPDVRQAVLADLEELAPLFDAYRQFQGRPSDVPAAREFLRARYDHGESVLFLCRIDGAAVGFAQLYPIFSSVALARVYVLNDLYVDARGRRRGAASALLGALEHHARSMGAVRISLNVARANTSAQALYEASGWKQDDQFFMYHRHPLDDA
jgi:ribosomal protein S18 acetylase RimI-like enzyme